MFTENRNLTLHSSSNVSFTNCHVSRKSLRFTQMGTIAQNELYRLLNEAQERNECVAMATVADTKGSTPQRRGAKMLFFENGETVGTVGGGCVEAEVWAEAKEALQTRRSALHRFNLTADEASEEGMVCGGIMEIFIEVI
jgi:xanthine dehydrogenase accessory factor